MQRGARVHRIDRVGLDGQLGNVDAAELKLIKRQLLLHRAPAGLPQHHLGVVHCEEPVEASTGQQSAGHQT